MKRLENSEVFHVAAFFFRSMKSLSWDDEAPAARTRYRQESLGVTGRTCSARCYPIWTGPKIRKRTDFMAFEPSVLEAYQPKNAPPENEYGK